MYVQLLGINHHTTPLELREALAMDGTAVLARLREICSNADIGEAAILATCNRTELYVGTPDPTAAEIAMRRLFSCHAGDRKSLVDAHAYSRTGEEAYRHLLRVASGLDSMILGEHQILGQVRDAQSRAQEAETMGPLMHRLWSAALHTGKRARAETDIGMGAVSVALATVSLAERALGDLRDRSVLLVGAGDTCRLAARHFADRRPSRLWVANRTLERAAAVAEAFGGEAVPFGAIGSTLPSADVVVSATRAPGFVVTCDMVRRAMVTRPDRRLVLIDIAVPRDIDPASAAIDNVSLFPIDAVHTLVDRSLAHRLREVPRVEAIVEDECRKLMAWTRGHGASSVVRELVERFERVRAEEVRRNLKHFHPEEEAYIDQMTKTLINRLLRPPITSLTSGDRSPSVESARQELLRELFALDQTTHKNEVSGGAP
jgi:glutamyl-tRNA reductase